jgi:uncharacterized protein YcbK (DUF882 family)
VTDDNATPSRRRALALLGAAVGCAAVCAAAPTLASPPILRDAGDIRMIRLRNPHTGDSLSSVYWVQGQYIPEVMAQIDHLMRDWRIDAVHKISPDVIDIMSAAHRLLDTTEPYSVFSGYRSRQTNAMLRQRSRGVARNSYHTKGMAADLHLESRSVRQIAGAASKLSSGGVGRYSRSNFVHMDCGPVRIWGA